MRKTTKKGEEAAVENPDVSPPKKSRLREKKSVPLVVPNRHPRAAKNRAAAQANDVENNAEPATKTRGRARQPLRRSKSTDNIASMVTGNMEKTKSKSAEYLDQEEEDRPPLKKARNPSVKTAKKTVAKKAGNEAKAKPVKKALEEAVMEDVAEESEEEQRLLIPKKAYSKVMKKAAPVETKEEKPKKRGAAKESATREPPATVKTTRGRTKPLPATEVEEDHVVEEPKEEAKALKGRKGKANGKKAAAAPVEEQEKEAVELDEKDAENVAEEVTENTEEATKRKKGGKKAAPAAKKPRSNKKTAAAAESVEKDVASREEAPVEVSTGEQEEAKRTKSGKKGKAPVAKKGGKKAQFSTKDLEDNETDNEVVVLEDDQEAVDVPQEPQAEPKENAKSLENGESNSDNEYEVEDDNRDSR